MQLFSHCSVLFTRSHWHLFFPGPPWGGEVEGQLTPPAPLGCNTASFKLTHESGVNSSCSLLFIGEQMRDSISSARWTQLTLRLGSHTTPAAWLWLGDAASQLSSVLLHISKMQLFPHCFGLLTMSHWHVFFFFIVAS